MPTVRRSLWSLWLVWIVCLGLSIGGYALAASGLADKGMERLAQAWDVVSQAIKVTLATTLAGEDVLNDVQRVESQFDYETVAASQTDQVMGTTGAAGDLLHAVHCVWTAAPAAATSIKDGAGSAMNIFEIKGGAGSQTVILDLVSADGGWKFTTSTNMTCIGIGRFS